MDYGQDATIAITLTSRGFRAVRVPDGEYARHRRGEGGAFPSLLTPVNQRYHRRAFVAGFERYFF